MEDLERRLALLVELLQNSEEKISKLERENVDIRTLLDTYTTKFNKEKVEIEREKNSLQKDNERLRTLLAREDDEKRRLHTEADSLSIVQTRFLNAAREINELKRETCEMAVPFPSRA